MRVSRKVFKVEGTALAEISNSISKFKKLSLKMASAYGTCEGLAREEAKLMDMDRVTS